MEQANIDRLNKIEDELTDLKQTYDDSVRLLNVEKSAIQHECDHNYPDGTNAVHSGFLLAWCKICYANDW